MPSGQEHPGSFRRSQHAREKKRHRAYVCSTATAGRPLGRSHNRQDASLCGGRRQQAYRAASRQSLAYCQPKPGPKNNAASLVLSSRSQPLRRAAKPTLGDCHTQPKPENGAAAPMLPRRSQPQKPFWRHTVAPLHQPWQHRRHLFHGYAAPTSR